MPKYKLDSLDLLRGIAVTAVCFCHFGGALEVGGSYSWFFHLLHVYGKYGVQVFFVISGFVIPLSLYNSGYTFKSYNKFLVKRLIRLHPPYLIALFITLCIGWVASRIQHIGFNENFISIFQSLFYMHVSEINPVFWTLAIETQYYLLIGLLFALVIKYPRASIFLGLPILLMIEKSFVSEYISFFHYVVFFLIGMVGFLIYTSQGSLRLNGSSIVILLIYSYFLHDLPSTISAAFTILVILFYKNDILSEFKYSGKISYSLYLIHFPIGVKFINLSSRYVDSSLTWILFPLALLIVMVMASILWVIIEKPSTQYSSKIKLKGNVINTGIKIS